MDYCHWHHHQHLCFIDPDISAVANGWLCFRRLIISPWRLTYYANADERLRHYHWLRHCYWLDHRHRHLHHVGCVCRRQLHNFIAERLHIHCWLTWLLPTGFFASTAVQLHHFRLVSLSSLPPIYFATSGGQYYLYIGRLVSMLTVSATINEQLWLRAQGLTSSNTSIIPSIWTCSGYMQHEFMTMGLFSTLKDWTIYYSP